MTLSELTSLLDSEFVYFDSCERIEELKSHLVNPRMVCRKWQYSAEEHECWIVGENEKHCLVWCNTGFGPSFPWSTQILEFNELGTDGEWFAYLIEAIVGTSLTTLPTPKGFLAAGPGER